jgi:hypothetical protein
MTDETEVESDKEKISSLEVHDVKCGSWATLRLFTHEPVTPCRPDGKDTAATRMYGRGGTANGSPSRLLLESAWAVKHWILENQKRALLSPHRLRYVNRPGSNQRDRLS